MARRERLEELTRRWEARHEQRRSARQTRGEQREAADPERVARARAAFPIRTVSPAEYVALHGVEMTAYTYDDYRYPDTDLQAWIDEVGRLLRKRRQMDR